MSRRAPPRRPAARSATSLDRSTTVNTSPTLVACTCRSAVRCWLAGAEGGTGSAIRRVVVRCRLHDQRDALNRQRPAARVRELKRAEHQRTRHRRDHHPSRH